LGSERIISGRFGSREYLRFSTCIKIYNEIKMNKLTIAIVSLAAFFLIRPVAAQKIPSKFEHVEALVTFGPEASPLWGDDDHVQVFFFIVPTFFTKPVYIRVFDPETVGLDDEASGEWDTKTRFSVFGGLATYTEPDARKIDPVGNFKSGQLLATREFYNEEQYDQSWYSFGPFNPLEGEEVPELGGNVFKVIIEGTSGNDGNLYHFFLSTDSKTNMAVEGSNAFTYEYSFRLPLSAKVITHLYPFADSKVESITQYNFDLDLEGEILLYTVAKNRHKAAGSVNTKWAQSNHQLVAEEKNTTLDLQIVKTRDSRNDMVMYVVNQYGEALPFFSVPVGGPPKYKYKVNVTYKKTGTSY
tara:strand:- start:3665 stop:4735 length:1071 start_codon:yes stop_codon:yes gene_type:complete